MGHRSTEMIFQHYRELVPKKEAEKFWQIMPETKQATTAHASVTTAQKRGRRAKPERAQ